jgi:acyl-CoA thioester hydrolase
MTLEDADPDATNGVSQPRPGRVAPAYVRVRFVDTDAAGVVSHERYLTYFEVGRAEAMRQVGIEYRTLISAGFHLPIVEARLRYLKPARYDDLLAIVAQPGQIGRARVRFDYTIRREEDGDLLVVGSTLHGCVDAVRMRPVRLPDWVLQGLHQLAARSFGGSTTAGAS